MHTHTHIRYASDMHACFQFKTQQACTLTCMDAHTYSSGPGRCFPSNPCFTGVEMASQVGSTPDRGALGCLGSFKPDQSHSSH